MHVFGWWEEAEQELHTARIGTRNPQLLPLHPSVQQNEKLPTKPNPFLHSLSFPLNKHSLVSLNIAEGWEAEA